MPVNPTHQGARTDASSATPDDHAADHTTLDQVDKDIVSWANAHEASTAAHDITATIATHSAATDPHGDRAYAAAQATAAYAAAIQRSAHTGTQAQSTVTNLVSDLALKAPLASPTFTGTVTIPSGAALGTPASATLTNATGLPAAGVTGTALVSAAIGTTVEQFLTPTAVKTGAYTAAASELVRVDISSTSYAITLPTSPTTGTRIGVKIVATASTRTATITCGGSDVIDVAGGSATYVASVLGQFVLLQYAGSNIWILQDSMTLIALDARYQAAATYAKTYSTDIGDGSTLSFTITHNLASPYPVVNVWDKSTGKRVEVELTYSSTTAFTVTYNIAADAPSTNNHRVMVVG